ncbi:hypothetical protein GS504_24250 [Rhodococcus hoagii]|nr:hypothetical protein [Prescottella equi]MBM4711061.1 hypothetical protein [Prescottella equi]NKS56129.1 hypothetical protein [Prescottella equi]NKS60567.1 hypothetical protein [Prescottella equi]NKV67615.1 hypothetical protein [Prescottella equi]
MGDRVDAGPVRRHVESLQAAGISQERIANAAGVNLTTVRGLLSARPGRSAPTVTMRRDIAEKLLAVQAPEVTASVAADGDHVDAIGTVRRLRALIAAGHPQRDIAARLGMRSDAVGRLMHARRCTAATHRTVADVFAEMQLRTGSSARSRLRGIRNGWALPLEWDEDTIDDPAAEPVRARRSARTPAASEVKRREAHELARSGMERAAIAHELGVHERTVERYLAVAS